MSNSKGLFDVISPIMIGPSSSHTAGAIRIGLMARIIYAKDIHSVTFTLYNSFAQTGKGHGTDKGLLAGLLGCSVDDVSTRDIFDKTDIDYNFLKKEDLNIKEEDITIKKGEIVGQAIFMPFLIADNDEAEGTRKGGFGSTNS